MTADENLPLVGQAGKPAIDGLQQAMIPPKENAALREAIVDFNKNNAEGLAYAAQALDYLAAALEARTRALSAKQHQDKKAEWAARAAGVNPERVKHFDVDKALVYFEKG